MSPSPSSKPKILVTGAAGFIGYHIIESLLRDHHPVIGLDNFDNHYPRATKEANLADLQAYASRNEVPFLFFEKDLRELTADDLKDHDLGTVIHLAAKPGVRFSVDSPEAYLCGNVQATVRLLEFCRRRHLNKLVYASSSSVYGNDNTLPFREDSKPDRPLSPYGASKRAAELFCHSYAHLHGIKTVVLRLFTVYGPRQRPDLAVHKFASLINAKKPVSLFGEGNSARDYTYVSDIVDGMRSAIRWLDQARNGAYEVFNLGGSHATSLGQLVRLLEKGLGVPAQISWLERQPAEMREQLADISKSHRSLGYTPKISIERGIDLFVKWFKSRTTSSPAALAA